MTTAICKREYSTEGAEDDDFPIDNCIALEIFEQAHFLYGTQSVEETLNVLIALGLEKVVERALDRDCARNLDSSLISNPIKYLESVQAG